METFFFPMWSLAPREKRNETKFACARSLARSFRRLFSSPSSRSIGYSPPLRRPAETPVRSPVSPYPSSPASPPASPPSVPAPDLPMEARSRDKLGQPIGIKSGRIGTPRPRSSPPLFSLSLSSLVEARGTW